MLIDELLPVILTNLGGKPSSKGNYKTWVIDHPDAVMFTVPDCNIEEYFKAHQIKYVLGHPPSFEEYKWIEKYYGDKTARRSGMHHHNYVFLQFFEIEQFSWYPYVNDDVD